MSPSTNYTSRSTSLPDQVKLNSLHSRILTQEERLGDLQRRVNGCEDEIRTHTALEAQNSELMTEEAMALGKLRQKIAELSKQSDLATESLLRANTERTRSARLVAINKHDRDFCLEDIEDRKKTLQADMKERDALRLAASDSATSASQRGSSVGTAAPGPRQSPSKWQCPKASRVNADPDSRHWQHQS
jgi:hypothetical protein